ncbi:MAG: B12-binding domain-containing radical SAM protein [Thermodesulfobacteriota bacterium]
MTDILLIQPPVQDFYLTVKRTMPYGLACIAAALRAAGFTVDLFDALATHKTRPLSRPPEMAFLEPYYGRPDCSPFALFHQFRHFGYSLERIGAAARDSGAFLIGISSLFTAYSDMALRTAETVKAFHPRCRIAVGGHHPTALPEAVMAHRAVDYVLRGEGEVSMPMLARVLQRGGDPAGIPGIVFRRTDGTLHISAPALMPDIDASPPPAMDLVKHSFYQRKKAGSTVIVGSRGCPMSCRYCAVAGWPYRRRSVSGVMEEVTRAVDRYGVRFIDFEDENLSLEKKWFAELLDRIAGRFGNLGIELRAMNGLYPSTLDMDLLVRMKKAGFRALNLSLGSVDPEQLQRFQRPDSGTAFGKTVQQARLLGLTVTGYIIVGAPGQSPETSVDDLLYLDGLGVLAGVSAYYPAPGSRDFQHLGSSSRLPDDHRLMRGSALSAFGPATREEIATLLRLGRILNFMRLLSEPQQRPGETNQERTALGYRLLQDFFQDGSIRGITPDGEEYAHRISSKLTARFIAGIKRRREPFTGFRAGNP